MDARPHAGDFLLECAGIGVDTAVPQGPEYFEHEADFDASKLDGLLRHGYGMAWVTT